MLILNRKLHKCAVKPVSKDTLGPTKSVLIIKVLIFKVVLHGLRPLPISRCPHFQVSRFHCIDMHASIETGLV